MNIKAYISSGILEEFVLDTLSEKEAEKVLELAGQYPEIKAEIERIEISLETYASNFASQPPKDLKASILGIIDDEKHQVPLPIGPESKLEDYSYWLNYVTHPTYEEMHVEVIGQVEKQTVVIAWVKNGELHHDHTEYTEKFLIAEGACTAIIDGVTQDYGVGDYIEFPIDVPHSYTVTSDCPMKVVACMQF